MDLNELQSLNIRELSKLAQKLNIDGGIAGLNRQALIVKILEANEKNDGSFSARGVLEVMQDGYGFLRSPDFNYMPGPDDIYVSPSQIKRVLNFFKITLFKDVKSLSFFKHNRP